jgi:ATP-binding cassette, subfamily F, member 3
MLVALRKVDKYYGSQRVLEDINFSLEPGDRIALIGRNGAGKSTLLRLLTREEEPLGGEVLQAKGSQIGILRQDPHFNPDWTVHDVLESAFHELDALEDELEKLNIRVALEPENADLQVKYLEALEHYQLRGGYERRSRRDGVALAFGFRGREFEAVSRLSGGEKTRLGLASILVSSPEVLLLDEPTNHLDIVMREWLEGFLSRYNGAMVLVSHDRAFLDAVSTKTAYLRDANLKVYSGNYSAFRKQLEQDLETQMALFETQQKQIDALAKSAARMKIWGLGMSKLARRAKSMETRLGRMKDAQSDAPPPDEDVAEIEFDCDESGGIVLEANWISKAFEGRQLFKNVQATVRKGDRIAVLGRNGAGKTTLIKTLLGMYASDNPKSQIRLGSRVKVGYYDQQLRGVDPEFTLYDEARGLMDNDKQARNLLGAFLFPYDTHAKKISSLSGGERARLAMMKLSLERNNLLVLDEPTNHLDMEMLESLEDALLEYPGTLILISHDRTFVEKLATEIWLLEDGEFYTYPGGYDYYKQKHVAKDKEVLVEKVLVAEKPKTKSLWHLKRKAEELEGQVATLEGQLEAAHTALSEAKPDADFAQLGANAAALEEKLLETLTEWERVTAMVEAADQKM